jgi:hypothetical protein
MNFDGVASVGLKGTEWARAQADTLRLKLLKIGAQIRITVRRVWISLAEGYAVLPTADWLQPSSVSGG